MLIKAGTYRFNDVLVLADVPRENEISCPVNFVLNTVAAEFGIPLTANCDKIFVHSQCMSYYVVSTDPDMTATGATLPWSYPIYAVEGYRDFGINGWNTVSFDEGIRTITVTADAEASDEFYAWFTANAVEQKEISGKWRFNDYLTPISGLQESVNFTAKYSFEYQGTHSGTVSCSGLSFIEGDGYAFRVRSMFNGLSDPTDQMIAESVVGVSFPFESAIYMEYMNGDDYGFAFIPQGFDFQTIDFGTTPQYVSAEFYEWFTANALKNKEISGKWRFREVLTLPAGAFKETVSFLNGGESFNAMYAKTIADTTGFGLEFSSITASGGEILLAYADGAYGDLFAVSGWADDACRTVDFGTESQAVSAEFYNWLTGNAVQSNGSLLYRGETIAELFPGQTVTLKCGGMRMEDDVVVRV